MTNSDWEDVVEEQKNYDMFTTMVDIQNEMDAILERDYYIANINIDEEKF